MIWTIIAWFIATPLTGALLYLSIELVLGLAALSPDRRGGGSTSDERLVILVPAHDEASGIAATVANLRQASPSAQLLVVADNCSDDTAVIARHAGAEVIERVDREKLGKGHALSRGRDCLAKDPPAAVLVVDADCRLQPGAADRLASAALEHGRPVQSANLLEADLTDSPLKAISNFAFLIKNLVRARGLQRLGGGALLFGTGMAFPWRLFESLPLATSDAVEDLQLGLWLANRGISVELVDSIKVTSPPADIQDTRGQRSRWEHGYMGTALTQAVPLLCRGIAQRSRNLTTLGAHLLIPPLALLMFLATAGLAVVAGLCTLAGVWWPLGVLTTATLLMTTMLLLAWWREGREVLSLSKLLQAPVYMLWKMPIYLKFFTNRQTAWNRTRRVDRS